MRALLVLLAACGANAPAAPSVTTFTTTELAATGDVGVVGLDGTVYAFDRENVTLWRAGRVVERVRAPSGAHWTSAARIPGPQGVHWVVGIAGDALWRVTAFGELERVSDRLGIGDARVVSVDGTETGFAIGLANGVAISEDGLHVKRFAGGNTKRVAIARDRVALAVDGHVEVLLLATGVRRRYGIGDVRTLGFLDAPNAPLVVVSGDDLYVDDGARLQRIETFPQLRSAAVSGPQIWIAAGDRLYVQRGGALSKATATAANARVFASARGGVWLAQAARLEQHTLAPQSAARWDTDVKPVFEAACGDCHEPGGEAELDLSTVEHWRQHADTLHHVLDSRTMPPPEIPLSDADRTQLLEWLRR